MISRANRQVSFPADFQLIAAMNPCPCGYYGDLQRHCRCTPDQLRRYQDKISGPLLDRIDMQLNVARLPASTISAPTPPGESSEAIRQRVTDARTRQHQRQQMANAKLSTRALERFCRLQADDQSMLERAVTQLQLSPRAYHRILRVARTIADLDKADSIGSYHLTEALSYRMLDKSVGGG